MRALIVLACIIGASVSCVFLCIPAVVFFSLCAIALPLDSCADYLRKLQPREDSKRKTAFES